MSVTASDSPHGTVDDAYEAPRLVDYGTIESWTQGYADPIINISIII